jgi:hypothetical protein
MKTYLLLRKEGKNGRGLNLEENEKIVNLIEYWIRHNEDHAKSYMEWASKAADAGNEDLSRILVKLYLESRRMNRLFEEARKTSS